MKEEPTKDLVVNEVITPTRLKPKESDSTELAAHIDGKLKKIGSSYEDILALTLIDAITNAVAPDNRGELHTDYRTRLKASEMLIKLKDKNYNRNDVNFNFFQAPEKLDY